MDEHAPPASTQPDFSGKLKRIIVPPLGPGVAGYSLPYRWSEKDDTRASIREPLVELTSIPEAPVVKPFPPYPDNVVLYAPVSGIVWVDKTADWIKPGDIIAIIYPLMPTDPPPHDIGQAKQYARRLFREMAVKKVTAQSGMTPVREPPEEIVSAISEPATGGHGIFISYRRSDEAAFAGRLYDRLVAIFGESEVFMDVDSIEHGLDFVEVLEAALRSCKVMLVVIGRRWLTAVDEDENIRLENPADFVRLEVEAGLERSKQPDARGHRFRVIPILVEGAPMPPPTRLPPDMARLAYRNGPHVSNARFSTDMIELINTLRRILKSDI